jgi:hypothetical protein
LGTKTHGILEEYINTQVMPPEHADARVNHHVKQFLKWYHNDQYRTWQDYRTEWLIFDEDLLLCGSMDYVGVEWNATSGALLIFDFKCTAMISTSSFGRFRGDPMRARGCLQQHDDCNGIKYYLQLNLYKYILQKRYGFHVKSLFLIQMHYSLKRPDVCVLPVPDMTQEVLLVLACRKAALEVGRRKRQEARDADVSPAEPSDAPMES